MPVEGVIVIGEPVTEGLDYGSCFFKPLAKSAPSGVTVKETDGTVEQDDLALEQYDPRSFYHIGHGTPSVFTVESMQTYIDSVSGMRMDDFKGRIVHLLSCETAQRLGPSLINHGADAYLGYSVPVVFGVRELGLSMPTPCAPPGDRYDYYTFNDCDVEVERAMLKGATISEAAETSKNKYNEYVEKYTTGNWKDYWVAAYSVRFLRYNRDNQKVYGNKNARLLGEEEEPDMDGELVGWDPFKWFISMINDTRPPVFITLIDEAIDSITEAVVESAPDIRVPGRPPPSLPKFLG